MKAAEFIGYSLLALALVACAAPPPRNERLERDFGAQCRQFGHAPDSADYRRCLQAQHNGEVQDAMQRTITPLR
jgi:hypothetical protein